MTAAMKRSLGLLVLIVAACGGGKPAEPIAPALVTPVAEPAASVAPVPAPAPVAKPVGHPKTDLIPRTVLFGNPERANVKISPNGKFLSWVAPRDGVMNVFVAPRAQLDQAKPITADKTRPVTRYFWAYDNKHILYLQDVGGDENYHLFRADLEGKVVDLTPYDKTRVNPMGLSERKPTTIMTVMNDRDPAAMDVYSLDILTGKRTLVFENKDKLSGFRVDPELKLAFAVKSLPDGGQQWLRWTGKTWDVFDTVPFEDADSTQIIDIPPGGKLAYIVDSRGRDTSALAQLDLASKKIKVLAENAGADAGDAIVHPTKHTPRAISFDTGRPQWQVLDKAIDKDLAALKKLAEGGEFGVVSMTVDDKLWVVATDSPQHPGHYFLYDHAKHTGTFLFAVQPALDQQPLVDMQVVTIPTRDGLNMVSYLTLPKDGAKPAPLVLFPHGGPWGRDGWGFDGMAQLLANRGYAVLQPNFRSSRGFGKKFLNAGNLEWGKKMQDDLVDAVQWAIAQGVTTKDQVAIMGGSYGGYATLAGLTMTPDLFRCGVDLFGPVNLLTLLATIPPYWAPMVASFKKRIGDWDTEEGKKVLVQASPLTHAAAIKRPLLIAQGANDARVKQAESEQIVAAMKQRKLPVTYIVFPDEGHGFARPENNIAFFGVAEAFLSAHLGGSYLPLTAEELKASSMQIKQGAEDIPGLPK
jgi:dipeptidyl aminopeptidase/acylaminoacyl peptidase